MKPWQNETGLGHLRFGCAPTEMKFGSWVQVFHLPKSASIPVSSAHLLEIIPADWETSDGGVSHNRLAKSRESKLEPARMHIDEQ
jgi:hypothetical protein